MTLGEVGHAKLQEAYQAYEALPRKAAASGVILHRRDLMVADGSFKWTPCLWELKGNALTLQPCGGLAQEANSYPITNETQYKKPKTKHYPLQFGSSNVYTTALLEKVQYQASGYAASPLDASQITAGGQAMESMGKVASLEEKDLEKLLVCIQAVKDGKAPQAYLAQLK